MDVFYTHMVAAHMLFPRNEQNRLGYVCLGLNSIISTLLTQNVPPEKLFPVLLNSLHSLFADIAYHKEFIKNYPNIITQWDVFQDIVANTRFSVSGKGSIEEAMIRGKIAGYVLTHALMHKESLMKAAERIVDEQTIYSDVINGAFILTRDNIINNIWPEFKQSAHLWAASNDFEDMGLTKKPVCKTVFLNLYEIRPHVFYEEYLNYIKDNFGVEQKELEIFPPSKYLGWQAFLDKSNSVLQMCEDYIGPSGTAKPILKRDECWTFPIKIQ